MERTLAASVAACDEARAWMTVPLGSTADDPRRSPGVDLRLWALHVRYQRVRCPKTLTALVEEYQPYVASLTQRLARQGESYDDLLQVATEALITALQRFECERRTPFAAFARPTIVGAIKRHYRDHGWSIRMPRAVHEVAPATRDARERLTVELHREPSASEIADELGIAEDVVVATDAATAARAVTSLDQPVNADGPTLGDVLGADDARLDLTEDHVALVEAMATLSDRERTVLGMYFYEEMSQTAIAEHFGVSQMQVSRWISRILGRLRGRLSVVGT